VNAASLEAAPTTLLTARLRLELPRIDHAAVVMEGVNASLHALRFVGWGQAAFDAGRAQRFCERDAARVAAEECLIYFAFEQVGGAFVGNLDLHSFDFDVARCQIGYVGESRRAGRGLMHEAATAMVQLAFALGLERVEAYCDVRNARSIRFAERLGMRREGVACSSSRDPQGELCDEQVLARRREDVHSR